MGQRLVGEVRKKGARNVEGSRIQLITFAIISYFIITAWSTLSANLVTDSTFSTLLTSTGYVNSINPNNPFGWNNCSKSVSAGNITFLVLSFIRELFGVVNDSLTNFICSMVQAHTQHLGICCKKFMQLG
jgi:hypothetical protein